MTTLDFAVASLGLPFVAVATLTVAALTGDQSADGPSDDPHDRTTGGFFRSQGQQGTKHDADDQGQPQLHKSPTFLGKKN
jgi:hypothetical protein